MKAIKKPIEILAKRYTKDSDLDSLLNLLRSNKNEPVRFEESTGDLFIQKDRGEIRLTLGNWIIFEENTDRCFWFIDHEIFLETYSFLAEEGEFSRFVKKVYEIEFKVGNMEYEYDINVSNGAIISSSAEIDD